MCRAPTELSLTLRTPPTPIRRTASLVAYAAEDMTGDCKNSTCKGAHEDEDDSPNQRSGEFRWDSEHKSGCRQIQADDMELNAIHLRRVGK